MASGGWWPRTYRSRKSKADLLAKHQSMGRDIPAHSEAYLNEMEDRQECGHMVYEDLNISKQELARFIKDRQLDRDRSWLAKSPSRRQLIKRLQEADLVKDFPKFVDLAPELRERIYELHVSSLPDRVAFPFKLPPIARSSQLLRREALPVIFQNLGVFFVYVDQEDVRFSTYDHSASIRKLTALLCARPSFSAARIKHFRFFASRHGLNDTWASDFGPAFAESCNSFLGLPPIYYEPIDSGDVELTVELDKSAAGFCVEIKKIRNESHATISKLLKAGLEKCLTKILSSRGNSKTMFFKDVLPLYRAINIAYR